ncbi:MAG: hypothetical protein SRB2_03091 [Desulfobacteraceae bacterium Eth-SRB2]|nr:MAG: hypothetical protein SRB2_03091 [Desulfobacteraceae bacterium Eth-SRB2]
MTKGTISLYVYHLPMRPSFKFRRGDFLKLVPAVHDLQSGMPVIMAQYSPQIGGGPAFASCTVMRLHKGISIPGRRWRMTGTRPTAQVVQTVYSTRVSHPLTDLFAENGILNNRLTGGSGYILGGFDPRSCGPVKSVAATCIAIAFSIRIGA